MAEEFRTPQSANEAALQNWAGADNELRAPQSRIEKLLLAILGKDVTPDPPQSVNEELLTQILEQGGGSGGESLFELYKTSAKYSQSERITADEKKELDTLKNNMVIAYAESDGQVTKAVRASASGRVYTFRSAMTDGTTNIVSIIFGGTSGTSAYLLSTVSAAKGGVSLTSPTIWFEYYKLKS